MIVADDLGTDKVGVYGEHPGHPPTPNIDAFAADGLLFRNAYSYPTCSASRAALLTGRYGRRNGMGGVVEGEETTWELPLAEVTLPEVLHGADRGYTTIALGKWHLSGPGTPSGDRHPNLQGFDHYAGSLGQLASNRKLAGAGGPYYRFGKIVDGELEVVERYATVDTADDAVRWLGKLQGPWLLYVAFHAPHVPFHVPPPELAGGKKLPTDATDVAKFDAAVQALDTEIGVVLAALTPEQRRTTTIVFIGDNGTDRNVVLPPLDPDHAKASLFEGGTNVPLIVAGARVSSQGETAALVHSVDVLPTVADLLGIDVSALTLDGSSFAPVLSDRTATVPRKTVFTERFHPIGNGPYDVDLVALRDDRYKIVRDRRGEWKFYDLEGRFDDGPGVAPGSLKGAEAKRYAALKEEIDTTLAGLRFAY